MITHTEHLESSCGAQGSVSTFVGTGKAFTFETDSNVNNCVSATEPK